MRRSRISKAKQEKLIELFVAGATGRCAAELVGVNVKMACYFYQRLRELIAAQTEREANEVFGGEIEVDKSCFGRHRKGNRGRGAGGRVPVFGLLKRGTLVPIIEGKVTPDSIVYSDCWKGYNVLDVSDFKHYRVNHSKLFADRQNHTNGIENFWNQAKRYLRKFNGVPKVNFGLFLKECEWRFNTPSPKQQLKQLKQWVNQFLN